MCLDTKLACCVGEWKVKKETITLVAKLWPSLRCSYPEDTPMLLVFIENEETAAGVDDNSCSAGRDKLTLYWLGQGDVLFGESVELRGLFRVVPVRFSASVYSLRIWDQFLLFSGHSMGARMCRGEGKVEKGSLQL